MTSTTWYERLKDRREQTGMNVAAFARVTGLSRQTIMAIENGEVKYPRHDTLLAYATALGMTPDAIYADMGFAPEPINALPDWQEELISQYAPDIPPDKARAFLEKFNTMDPALWDALLVIMQGLASDEPPRRSQHGT